MRLLHSRWMSFALAFAVAVAAWAAAAGPAAAETDAQKRAGWFVGFGVGGGTAGVSDNGSSLERQTAGAGSFRVGYDFDPDLGVGLESNAWSKSENSVTNTFSVSAATLSYHPPAANGLVLRGGIGVGTASATVTHSTTTVSISQSGFGFTVGGQYDFRVRRTFSLGPQIDFGWLSLDNNVTANYVNFGITFDWHFIGR